MHVSLDAYSRTVAVIHAASADSSQWPAALNSIISLVQASMGGILEFEGDTRRLIGITPQGHDPNAAPEYVEHYCAIDPTLEAAFSIPVGVASVVYELISKPVREKHAYFEYNRKFDIGDSLAVFTDRICGRRVLLSLQRPYGAKGFDAGTKHLLQLLKPHIEQAKHIEFRLAEEKAAQLAVAAGLDQFAAAAFILETTGNILHLNSAAEAMLSKTPTIRVRHQRLFFSEPGLNSAVECALRRATHDPHTSTMLGIGKVGAQPAELMVSPLHGRNEVEKPWGTPLALVVITEPRCNDESISQRVRTLYGLSAAEARVMTAIALGADVEEITRTFGVKEPTVRAQLRSIFGKTGVARQSDLVRLALAGTRFFSRPPA